MFIKTTFNDLQFLPEGKKSIITFQPTNCKAEGEQMKNFCTQSQTIVLTLYMYNLFSG